MPRKTFITETIRYWKEADDVSKLVFGKRLKDIFANFMTIISDEPATDPDDPYACLGVQHSARDRVVKFAFRAAAFEYHPDTGVRPDPVKFQKAVEAYDKIMADRKKANE